MEFPALQLLAVLSLLLSRLLASPVWMDIETQGESSLQCPFPQGRKSFVCSRPYSNMSRMGVGKVWTDSLQGRSAAVGLGSVKPAEGSTASSSSCSSPFSSSPSSSIQSDLLPLFPHRWFPPGNVPQISLLFFQFLVSGSAELLSLF